MRLLSTRELAEALGVSESSLKRWVDAGKIAASRTEGGHRRIALAEAVRFIRTSGAPLARPELLGMPEVAVAHDATLDGRERLLDFLLLGDVIGARGWLLARYLGGATIAELADGPIRDAMHALGELWRHDDGGVFVEHRGTDTCLQAVAHLRNMLEVPATATLALGGAPEDDPYLLPSFLAAMVTQAAGLAAVNLGPDTPLAALQHAVQHHAPRLVWVSATAPINPARARAVARWLSTLDPVIAVVGGQHGAALAGSQPGLLRLDTMAELAAVASRVSTSATTAVSR
jgi:MerR family transcriptional regulator, light-induced transcriptional regulator